MSAEHSPTPWSLGRNGDDCAENHAICRDGMVIAKVYGRGVFLGRGEVSSPDSEADAIHIVKCVNLHDDLVEALVLFLEAEAGNGWSQLKEDCPERISFEKAKAAIAKARAA